MSTDLTPTGPRTTTCATTRAMARLDVATIDPADVDADAGLVVELGPDWTGIGSFAASMAALVVGGPVIGHAVAGPAGTIIGAGTVAAALFTGAHVWAWLRVRRIDARSVDARSIETGSAVTGPAGWAWFCDPCGTVSVETSTPDEAVELADVHDGLHHGRPTARITRTTITPAARGLA